MVVVFDCVIAVILLLIVVWTVRTGISPMPTFSKVKMSLFSNLPETAAGRVYELGSGWGTLARPLARRYPDCQVTAFELSPIPYLFSKIVMSESNLSYVRDDFFQADLSDAKLIICYLYPAAMVRLQSKFEKELKKGTLVVTHTFAIPGWKADKTIDVADLLKTKIYLYRIS